MRWLDLPRVPEPEVMDDSAEVEAYSSAAAQAYLDKIDDTFVEHALRLIADRSTGRALDIGTGPGQIVLKLARCLPGWYFVGVDRSPNMIRQARVASGLSPTFGRVQFLLADGSRLPFPHAAFFDLVLCNSVLHHLAQPQLLLAEVARVVKPDAAILIRDLRRPSRLAYPFHVRWYGRHYSGLMYQLYCASVRSAYTVRELRELLHGSPLVNKIPGAKVAVFTHGRTHTGLERPSR